MLRPSGSVMVSVIAKVMMELVDTTSMNTIEPVKGVCAVLRVSTAFKLCDQLLRSLCIESVGKATKRT